MPDPALALLIGLSILTLGTALAYPERGLIARWRRARPRPADVLKQDALKFILQREIDLHPASGRDLAERLGVHQDRSAALVEELARSGLLREAEARLTLTAPGREQAARVIRAHRLWERHLADDTGFTEAEWHALADREEHRLDPDKAEALDRRLGHPARDPHGDPIPTADGALAAPPGMALPSAPPGSAARITHVEDEPPEIYARLTALGLTPGIVVRRLPSPPEVVVLRVNGAEVRLPIREADSLAVVVLPDQADAAMPAGRPLHELQPGERGVVLEISPRCRGAERRRMLDLGILPGTEIEAVMTSPGGDPTAYRIRDALIALRRTQAALIRLAPEAA